MTATAPVPLIPAERLSELLDVLSGADSVELKLTVDPGAHRRTLAALGLDPLDAQLRIVTFFDTPDLRLQAAGVVVRARRVQGKADDTVVKLRPVQPAELPKKLRRHEDFGVEVDAMRGGFVCSASFKGTAKTPIRETLLEDRPLRKLFSKPQREFYAAHAPEGLVIDDLVQLGPIFVLKLKGQPAGLKRKVVAELWSYPDGSRILELSTKCLPKDAFAVTAEVREWLQGLGIEPAEGQQTKTKKALGYFTAQYAERGGAVEGLA